MRIIAGTLRGRRLRGVGNRDLRPTLDRVRESLFDILGSRVEDARVLDLFAGTGALGIEAVSRGAREVVFVESAGRVVALLQSNLRELGIANRCQVRKERADRFLADCPREHFDVILADPPYDRDEDRRVVRQVAERLLLAPSGVLVVEGRNRESVLAPPARLETWCSRRYGDTRLDFFVRSADGSNESEQGGTR